MAEDVLKSALRVWESAKDGIPSVVGGVELDVLAEHFRDDDSEEARIYFAHSSTIPNPNRVGLRDTYLIRLSDEGQRILRNLQPDTPSTF